MNVPTAFGIVLRRARQASKLSQSRLAELAGYDRTYIGMLERAERQPTLETVFALAKPLGVSAVEIVLRVELEIAKT